jgi:hypothetical protein
MPTNWQEQGQNMAYRIIYLVKLYPILPCLVVNSEQFGIHLVSTIGERTWESKGIQVLGVENKRQVTMVVSSIANEYLLPRQFVHQFQLASYMQ